MRIAAEALRAQALKLGFNLVGITRAEPSPTIDAYQLWIDQGMHGTMAYMARPDRQARRQDPSVILPGAQSFIIVGLDYRSREIPDSLLEDPARGRIASYAWNLDYHDLMLPRLEALADWLAESSGQRILHRTYVDTGAILERSYAQQAGMGFIGKNTMLIHPRRGSYFFLGEILTDVGFDQYDKAHRASMCGSCTRCLQACPTDAFPAPYVLDSRRCISYLTIEHKGWIGRDLRPLMGNWIFGCDICQDVCPFQRFALPTEEAAFIPNDMHSVAPNLVDVLALDDASFAARYRESPIYRIKRERFLRNACIAAGNGKVEAALSPLLRLLDDPSPLLRAHAVWAIRRIGGTGQTLKKHYERETDPQVRNEIEAEDG